MRPALLLTISFILFSISILAQVSIGGDTPPASAILELRASDKGLLPPRLTSSQRTAIASPATGLIVYDTDINSLMIWNGSSWVKLAADNNMDVRTNVSPAPVVTGVGLAVAMSGNDAIVASSNKVYFYTFNGSGWTLGQTLSGSSTGDSTSVAIYGNFAAFGASTSGGICSVDVFERDPNTNTWAKTVTLSRPDNLPRFGQSVAISDSFLVVGAPAMSSYSTNDGIVLFYKRTADPTVSASPSRSNWLMTSVLNASGNSVSSGNNIVTTLPPFYPFFQAGDRLGRSLAIDGDWCIISVPGRAYNNNAARGMALMYAYNGTTWDYRGTIMPSDTTANMRFGNSIAMSNGRAVIGAQYKDAGTTSSTLKVGAAYVFEARPFSGWKQTARLIYPYTPYANANFGRSVALSDDYMVIGVNGQSPYPNNYWAILYRRDGSQWTRINDLNSPVANKSFGVGMAASGAGICIGEPGSGQVYFYK